MKNNKGDCTGKKRRDELRNHETTKRRRKALEK